MQHKFSRLFAIAASCLIAVMTSQAQSSPAPSPEAAAKPLTAEERDVALKTLQATNDGFLKAISGLSEKQ